jgi:DNA-binding transcriptional MocR family regulator
VEARTLAGLLGPWSDEDATLYRALALRLAALIGDGSVPPGTRLPSERRLAEVLHVARGTVLAAYGLLRDDGLVETARGSGTLVRPGSSALSGPRAAHIASALATDSAMRAPAAVDADVIDLRGAYWFGGQGLDTVDLDRLGTELRTAVQGHGYEVYGLPALRSAIAQHLTARGVPTTPEQVLVTSGAQQAIALTVQLHVGVGDDVVVEDPTYAGAIEALVTQHAAIHTVPVGRLGVELGPLDAAVRRWRPRLLYLTPTGHNPTGVALAGPARHRLVELAAGWDAVLLDDTTLAETARGGPVPRPLAADASAELRDRIVTVGSLSKVTWGGLRIGWLRADQRSIELLGRLKAISDVGTAVLSQLTALQLLERLDDLADRRRQQLQVRHDVLLERLRAQLPSWHVDPAPGGLCLWVDTGVDAAELAARAAAEGVAVLPGTSASARGGFGTHLRLPFGQPEAVLEHAVDRLARAWAAPTLATRPAASHRTSVVV